jgi:predicted ATPase
MSLQGRSNQSGEETIMMRITPLGASAVVLTIVTSTLLLPRVRGGILSFVARSPKPNRHDTERKPLSSDKSVAAALKTTTARAPRAQQKAEPVFVSERGTKYHREECRTLRGQGRKISLVEARGTYDPCKLCDPPV